MMSTDLFAGRSGVNNTGEREAQRLSGIKHLTIETLYGAGGKSRILSDDLAAILIPVTDDQGGPNFHPLFRRVFEEKDVARFWIDDQACIRGRITKLSESMLIDGAVQAHMMTIEEA